MATSGGAVVAAAAAACASPGARTAPTPIDVASGATRAADAGAALGRLQECGDDAARAVRDAPVVQARDDDPAALAHALLKAIHPAISGDRVFVKPNLNFNSKDFAAGRLEPGDLAPVTVSPRFIEGVLDYFRERGVPYAQMSVGEGFGYRTTANGVMQFLGVDKLCAKRGAQTIDLNAAEAVRVRLRDAHTMREVEVAEPYWTALRGGVVVSCAKLKTHRYPVTTLTLKNLIGVILPYNQKWRMHAELVHGFKGGRIQRAVYLASLRPFASRLADLYALTPQVALVDGSVCGEGDGLNVERGGGLTRAVRLGVGFGGRSSVNVDAVASAFIGFPAINPNVPGFPEIEKLPWLTEPASRGYGHTTPPASLITGAILSKPNRFLYTCKYRII